MAVVNRTLDPSEQKDTITESFGALATGVSSLVGVVPYPCEVSKVVVGALGLSNTPTAQILVTRLVTGGATILNTLMGAQAVANVAAAVPTSMTFEPGFMLQTNDILTIQTGGTDSAVQKALVSIVVKKSQDIVSYFGSET